MLQLNVLREKKESIVKALTKRNLDAQALVDAVLDLDEKRRSTQAELDNTLAESNRLSKEIGLLFKIGKTAEANAIKAKTSELKEASKVLSDTLNSVSQELQETLYQLPNVPHESVPS